MMLLLVSGGRGQWLASSRATRFRAGVVSRHSADSLNMRNDFIKVK